MHSFALKTLGLLCLATIVVVLRDAPVHAVEPQKDDLVFFERHIRPLLIRHCYECHSEEAGERQGELLLDRRSGWMEGGATGKAVTPGNLDASLLIKAVRRQDEGLQMPPDSRLDNKDVSLLEQWVLRGAPGPREDLGETEFSRLGDQAFLFGEAAEHWAFQPVHKQAPPDIETAGWSEHPIDRWIVAAQQTRQLTPSPMADARTVARRLHFDLTGLPPTSADIEAFNGDQHQRLAAVNATVDRLLASQEFGEHFARLWLDVARYADTDSFYRPDTRTPHYFPFAFTYRNYVIESFNDDKPYDLFLKEQLAADLMGYEANDPRLAALGFLTAGPHANRSPTEALDDWIDVTTRGLMGLTAACARCHDHKFEPIPTADYYALHGVFASVLRLSPLDEQRQPELASYQRDPKDIEDYEAKRAKIDAKIGKAGNSKAKGNNRSVAKKIRETELAELLTFHPGAPVRTMVVLERSRPVDPYIQIRGSPSNRGDRVDRRFLKILDPQQSPFPADQSGRLQLAGHIASADNPLTARVFVNRVWGKLMGSHLVETPSDFGLQGAAPSHPELLDWLTADFMEHGWSLKHLVRQIVTSRTYLQRSTSNPNMASDDASGAATTDPTNRYYWRANRKRLSIEAIRDTALHLSGLLERGKRFKPEPLWGKNYTRHRSVYGYINRFNLDPTLRAFDFPTPMQTQPARAESIVPTQTLFTMNSPFVIDQAVAIAERPGIGDAVDDKARVEAMFDLVFQRAAHPNEFTRIQRFAQQQSRFFPDPKRKTASLESPWPLAAQAMLMSNEFQYVD